MNIQELLDENIIHLNKTFNNKHEVIGYMATQLKEYKYIDDIQTFVNDIYDREKLGTTGIGDYIAIPHGQSKAVNQTTISILTLNNEIDWESLDGKGVKIVILFVVEDDEEFEKHHLKILASVASKLAHKEVKEALISASNKKDIIKAFTI